MIRADYLVVTAEKSSEVEAAYPIMIAYWLPEPKPFSMYGFVGYRDGKVFIGEREDRILVQATGAVANDVAMRFPLPTSHPISVARIDVQTTIWTEDADRLIAFTEPSKAYKSTRYVNINERGSTLYVGSPSSNVRLRIYNKTAESGIKPPRPGDYLRVELQFRNERADRMFRAIRARAPRFPFLLQLKRMVDTYMYSIVEDAVKNEDKELFYEEDFKDDNWIERRKAWIERCVISAIRKVIAEEPEYKDVIISLLDNPQEDTLEYK